MGRRVTFMSFSRSHAQKQELKKIVSRNIAHAAIAE